MYSTIREIRHIFRFRRMIGYLIGRELLIAHRNKLLGNLWTLFDPLLMMMVLYFVLHYVRNATIVFTLYLFSGLLAWDIFSKSISGSTGCLRANKGIAHKYPIPLSVFPISIVAQKAYDFLWGLIAYLAIFAVVFYMNGSSLLFNWRFLLLPVWLFFYLLLTLGICLMVARIGVFFRDMTDIIQVLLRVGFFLNPIFITIKDHLPDRYHVPYFLLNPIGGYLIYLRALMPGGPSVLEGYTIPIAYYPLYLGICSVMTFATGLWIFVRGQRHYTKYM